MNSRHSTERAHRRGPGTRYTTLYLHLRPTSNDFTGEKTGENRRIRFVKHVYQARAIIARIASHRRLINYVSREKDEYWIRILIRSDPATRQLEQRTRKEKEKKVSSKQGQSSLLLPFHRREYYIIDRTHVLMLPCPPAWSTRNLDTRPDAARGTSLSLSPQIYFSIIVGISKTLGE